MRLPAAAKKKEQDEAVAPGEDLMREHGVLNRALLVYEAWLMRDGAPAQVLAGTADLIRRFIEGYHEKTEEEEVFPRFEKAGKLVELTRVLRAQHDAGRRLTSQILAGGGDRAKVEAPIRAFIRMYRPHEAREDTVLFPAFQKLVGHKEYDRLGDDCDFVTLAGDWPYRYHVPKGDPAFDKAPGLPPAFKEGARAFDDLIGRSTGHLSRWSEARGWTARPSQ